LQIAQETAVATATGTTADAIYNGTGNATVVSILKGIVATINSEQGAQATAANQATQITAANLSNTTFGTVGDTAWTSGNGTVIALLKAIASADVGGTQNVSDATTHTSLASILAQDTATNTVLGTQADVAWVSGNGTAIALLKGIFGKFATTLLVSDTASHTALSAIQTSVAGTLLVSDATSHTSLSAIQTAVTGTLATSDAVSHTSLSAIQTAITGTLLTSDALSHTSLTAIQTAVTGTLLVSDATTHTSLASLVTAVGAQGVAAPAGILRIGGIYNTTLPTLLTGQSSGIQLDASGRVIIANGTGGIVTVSSGTSANSLAAPIHVDISQAAAALSATNGLYTNIIQAAALVSTSNPLFIQDTAARASLVTIGTNTGSSATSETAIAAATGTQADATWTTGNGTVIALLKAIATAAPAGGATSANQTLQLAQETASAQALGTTADAVWVSGNGTLVSLLKAIASGTSGGGAVTTVADEVAGSSASTGMFNVGGVFNTSAPTLLTGQAGQLQLNTNGRLIVVDAVLETAITTQAAVPGTGVMSVGGIFNTTAPTLTTGQASKLQVDVNGSMYVNIRSQAASILNTSDAGSHTSLATIASAYVAKASAGAPAFLVGIGVEALASLSTYTTATTNSPVSDLNGRLYVTDDQSHVTLSSILTQDTAQATASGTPADVAWTTGSGSIIALLKAIATVSIGTSAVSDATTHTSLTSLIAAVAPLVSSYSTTGGAAPAGQLNIGALVATAAPTLTTATVAPLSLTTSGALRVSDPLLETAATTQAATPGTGLFSVGGIFNTALPSLTTGQASKFQLDTNGRLILGTSTASIGAVTIGAGAAAIGSVTVSSSALPTGASTAAVQATQQTSLTAIAAAEGTTADTAWVSGAGSAIALQKAIATAILGTLSVADTVSRAALGTPADTAWTTGAGTMIALLKTIASSAGGGGGTVTQGPAGASAWLMTDTVVETGIGTPADTAWTAGSGSIIALLKAIATISTGTQAVSDGTSHTTLSAISSSLAGTLTVSDNTTHTSLSTIVTSGNATAAAMGTTVDVAWTSGAGTMIALLKKIAAGSGGGAVTTGADNTQGAAAGTGLFSVGGAFLTTLPTLTNGQAGHLQLTASGLLMTADQGAATTITTQAATPGTGMQLMGGLFNTTPPTLTSGQAGRIQLDATGGLILGASAKVIGAVNVDMGGVAVAATAPLATKEYKGAGAMTATPAGSTNGTALGTMISGGNGARIYLKPSDSLTFTIAASAPGSAPTAIMTITGNITGPNWDEPLAAGQMMYITVKVGTPMFRFL
jgi:hypothetical protein